MSLSTNKSRLLLAATAAALTVLAGCSTTTYRCDLDPTKKPSDPTACSSMHDAMAGAKRGGGNKVSVLQDEKGRLIPPELTAMKAGQMPAAALLGEPYRDKTGAPVFHQPKVFQVYSASFVDSEGNLHDGHHAWFSTPGRWAYGSMDQTNEVGSNVMAPARPGSTPAGIIHQQNVKPGQIISKQMPAQAQAVPPTLAPKPVAALTTNQAMERAALQSLSNAANAHTQTTEPHNPVSNGITAPGVKFGN